MSFLCSLLTNVILTNVVLTNLVLTNVVLTIVVLTKVAPPCNTKFRTFISNSKFRFYSNSATPDWKKRLNYWIVVHTLNYVNIKYSLFYIIFKIICCFFIFKITNIGHLWFWFQFDIQSNSVITNSVITNSRLQRTD